MSEVISDLNYHDIESAQEKRQEIRENNDSMKTKMVVISILFMFSLPFIVLDLYYGYNDTSCVDKYYNVLNISIKDYLLVCGYLYLIITTIILLLIVFINEKNGKDIRTIIEFYNIYFNSWILAFTIVWNIIGSILFWNKVYPTKTCNSDVSDYLFVSLILKFILQSIGCCLNFQ
jgi:hypothetical protein